MALLSYTADIDQKVAQLVSEVLYDQVDRVQRLVSGEFNFVYKVETPSRSVVVKVFRDKDIPEIAKLAFINKTLDAYGIALIPILFIAREQTLFPYGCMISECIDGQNGLDAVKTGIFTFEEIHEYLAKLLNHIHVLTMPQYGQIHTGEGEYADYLGYKKAEIQKKASFVADEDKPLADRVYSYLEQRVQPYLGQLYPSLVHFDAAIDNCMVRKNTSLVLLDWDHAVFDTWIVDYAWITYCGSHADDMGSYDERREKIKTAFMHYHDLTGLAESDIDILEHAFHAVFAFRLLAYYHSAQGNKEWYVKTKERLMRILGDES